MPLSFGRYGRPLNSPSWIPGSMVGLCLHRGTWLEGLFLLPSPTLGAFFLLGPPKAGGLVLSAREHMGLAAAHGCFTSLDKQREEKLIYPGVSSLPIFWHPSCLWGESKRSAKHWCWSTPPLAWKVTVFLIALRALEALEVFDFPHLKIWFA